MEGTARLRVLTQRIVTPDGDSPPILTVLCPPNGCSAPVDACVDCPRWAGLYLEPTERLSYVVCAVGTADPGCGDRVLDVMTPSVVCVAPDLSAEALTALFIDRGISGAPVVERGKAIGVVSRSDLLRDSRGGGCEPGRVTVTARDLMSAPAIGVPASATVAQAAAVMASEEIHRVVVLGDAGQVIGVLTSLDVARWVASAAAR